MRGAPQDPSSRPSSPKGEESIAGVPPSLPSCPGRPLPAQEEMAAPARDGVQDEAMRGAVSGRPAVALLGSPHLSLSGKLGDRCKAGTKSGGSHYLALGSLGTVARLESHPAAAAALGQLPDGFAHSFSFPE